MPWFSIKQVPRRPPFRAETYIDGDQVLLRLRHNVFFIMVAGIFAAAAIVTTLDLLGQTRVVPHGPLVLIACLFAALFFVRLGFDYQDWHIDLTHKLVVHEGYYWLFSRSHPVTIDRIEIVPITLLRGAERRTWDMYAVVIRGDSSRYWIVAIELHAPTLIEWVKQWAPAELVSRSQDRMYMRVCV